MIVVRLHGRSIGQLAASALVSAVIAGLTIVDRLRDKISG